MSNETERKPRGFERRRLHAVALLDREHQPVEVARMLGVDRRSIRHWKAAYLKDGTGAIKAKPSLGRPQKLDVRAKKELEHKLLKGAKAAGFPTDLWTCPRVAQVIFASFGVRYHVDHIGRLLRSLGLSPQKPQRRAVERYKEGIRQWIKQKWPRIKKTSCLKAFLVFVDKSGMLMAPVVRRSWAPRGINFSLSASHTDISRVLMVHDSYHVNIVFKTSNAQPIKRRI